MSRKSWDCGIRAVAVVLCVGLLLCGCTGSFFATASYRQCKAFSEQYKAGWRNYDKQDVYNKLGLPDGYSTSELGYTPITYKESELLFAEDIICWVYRGYELPDPANPFQLTVRFDEQGNCIEAIFTMVAGG